MGFQTSLRPFAAFGLLGVLAGCASLQPHVTPPGIAGQHRMHRNALSFGTKLRHIVVVVMENRTFNNLFLGYVGADTQNWGLDQNGSHVKLTQISLNTAWDPTHSHLALPGAGGGFYTEVDNFKNDGWANETFADCNTPPCTPETAYAFVQRTDVQNYWDFAKQFTLSDEVFQDNEGASYIAHQYLIAGQANGYTSSHLDAAELPPGSTQCPSAAAVVPTVDLTTAWPGVEEKANQIAPCQEYPTIYDLVDTAAGGGYPAINWKSYVPATTVHYWNGPMSVQHLYNLYKQEGGDSGTGNFIVDPGLSKFASDVATGNLPPLSYIIPCPDWSDHPGKFTSQYKSMYGPSFVSFIANTIGLSAQYWTKEPTAIVVVWDDWGGWYDNETPFEAPNPLGNPSDPNNYGYRVPMLVISPFSKAGVIDTVPKTQSAILTFIEAVFHLGTLGDTDLIQYSKDNLLSGSVFNFNQAPIVYKQEPLQPGAPSFGSSSQTCPNPNNGG
jgi:phospholipase C